MGCWNSGHEVNTIAGMSYGIMQGWLYGKSRMDDKIEFRDTELN